jgi:MFS transporter, FHS family, L-fucose permease
MQLAFLVSMACFIYVGCYFFGEMKKQSASVQPSEKPVESV